MELALPAMVDPPRRGRPPDERLAAERRRALVDAAYAVFAEKGYAAAGIADIDERLDVGHGTFYRHFESKREILDHVVDHALDRFLAEIAADAPVGAATTFDEFSAQMDAIARRVFAIADAEPGLIRLLLFEATSIDDDLTLRLLELLDTLVGTVAAYLDHGVRAGFLRADLDTGVVADGLTYVLLPGLIASLRRGLDDDERERYRRGVFDLFASGVRARA
jgi:AcrR family transcriptional regulator